MQTAIAADTVVLVHHWVAEMQLGQIANYGSNVTIGLRTSPALRGTFTIQLWLGDYGKRRLLQPQTLFQISNRKRERRLHGQKCRPIGTRLGVKSVVMQQPAQYLAPSGCFRHHQHASAVLLQPVEQCGMRNLGLGCHRQ